MAGARAGITYGGVVGLKDSVRESSTSKGLPGFKVYSFRDDALSAVLQSAVVRDAYAGALVADQRPSADVGLPPRAAGPGASKAGVMPAAVDKREVYASNDYPSMRAEFARQNPDLKGEVHNQGALMADWPDPESGSIEGLVAPGEEGGTFSWGAQGGMEYISPQEWEEFAADQAELEMTPNEIVSEFWGGAAGQEVYQGEAW